MKTIRFASIALAIAITMSLLLGTFAPAGIPQSAASAPAQSFNAAALGLPSSFSPFLMAASAPVVSVVADSAYNGYACQLMSQDPPDWTRMGRRHIFDATWTLKNTGSKVWGRHGVDLKYRGGFPVGTDMHTGASLYDIHKNVGLGNRITFILDMIAPKKAGNYVSNWGLYVGSQVFCKFYIAVTVTQ